MVSEHVAAPLDDDVSYLPGRSIGPYTIVRELGRGGTGRVYLATDARLGRAVALKALAPRLTRDPSHRERLRREARAAAALTHPGICTIYALEEHGGELFIAAEYVDGRTLRDEISSGRRPSPANVLATAQELASALAGAHARGVSHLDLKPENVMRTRDGRVKILDFGLARVDRPVPDGTLTSLTQPGMVEGTPGYMAPEQLNGNRGNARADVFAYGVLLYEYACGVHPFKAPSTLAVAARILESNAAPLEQLCAHLPAPLSTVVERCLRKAPGDRYASAIEIAAALVVRNHSDRRPIRRWCTHQGIILALYFLASALAWLIKEWHRGDTSVASFAIISVAATAAGVFRGHLLFTDRMNQSALATERRRADKVTLIVDLLIAFALVADTLLVWSDRTLPAVLTAGLAVGMALTRLIVEPSTSAAAFPDNPDRANA